MVMKKRIAVLVLTILLTFSVGIKFKDISVHEDSIVGNADYGVLQIYDSSVSDTTHFDFGRVDQ